jgi:hypothetical protein
VKIRMQETSLEAWDLWQGKPSAQLDSQILNALGDAGPDGLMCWQIEMEINRTHQAVSGNMTHLAERGAIIKTSRKGKTPRGFTAYYWVHAAHAPQMADEIQMQASLFD